MSVKLAYQSQWAYGQGKAFAFKGTFVGNYGVNGVGDLLNLTPSQNGGADGGITDPFLAYDMPLNQPTINIGVFTENLGGSYCQIKPAAAPSLLNTGLQMFEPGGTEKASAAAYTAAELAGYIMIVILIPGDQ